MVGIETLRAWRGKAVARLRGRRRVRVEKREGREGMESMVELSGWLVCFGGKEMRFGGFLSGVGMVGEGILVRMRFL